MQVYAVDASDIAVQVLNSRWGFFYVLTLFIYYALYFPVFKFSLILHGFVKARFGNHYYPCIATRCVRKCMFISVSALVHLVILWKFLRPSFSKQMK